MKKTDEPIKRMANLQLSHAGFAAYYKGLLSRNHQLIKENRRNHSYKHFFQKVPKENASYTT